MNQLIRVATFYSIPEALCAKAAIERLGIPCCLSGFELASMNWLYLNAIGGISMLVPGQAQETANAVLQSADSPSHLETAPEAFARRPLWYAFALVVTWLIGAPIPMWLRERQFRTRDSV